MRCVSFEKAPDPQSRSKPDVSIATLDVQARIRNVDNVLLSVGSRPHLSRPGLFEGTGAQGLVPGGGWREAVPRPSRAVDQPRD